MKKTKGLAVIMLLLICFMAFVACDGVVSPIKSVTLTKLPTKVVYNIGEKFDPTGGQITAVMTKDDEVVVVDITADMCGEVDTTKAGKVDVKIGYLEKSVTFQITVVDPSVKTKSIEVTTKPTKVGYLIGEKFSAAGGKLTVTKTDDTKEIIDLTDAMCGTVSTATAGKVAVTVTYQEKSTTFEITVAAPTVSSIAVSANPTKVEYIAGVAFSAVGGKISVSYSNGDIKVIDMTDAMCGTVDTSKVGKVAVTVTYETKTATFDITVIAPAVSSIAVTTNPTKLSYFVGEVFSALGGKITVTMTDTTTNVIDLTDAMCGTVSTATAGTVTVTVTYETKTATFDITVAGKIAPTIATAPTASGIVTYGDALPAITGEAKDGANIVAGAFTLDAGQTLTVANATYNYTFAPTDTAKYATVKGTATITVVAKALTITGVTATDRVYDGTTVVALTVGTLNGKVGADDVTHTLGAGSIADANVGDLKVVTYTATLTGTTAGNYTVTVNDVKVNIAKATYDMSGVTFVGASKVYNGEVQTLAIGGTALPQDVTVVYSAGITNVGTQLITATFATTSPNYNTPTAMTATLTITKADYVMSGVTFVDASKVYNGAEQTLAIGGTVLPQDVTVGYSAGITNVGSQVITATFATTSPNYNAPTAKTATLTITQKALTITGVTATDRVYDGTTVVTLVPGTLNGKIGADDVTFTLGAGSIADANVGNAKVVTYTATLTGATAGNYTVTVNDVKVNIAKATYDMTGVSFVDESKVYNGFNQYIEITGTLPQGVTVEYGGRFNNVGTQAIQAAFTGDVTNYNAIDIKTATLTITPKALTITGVTATDRVYDGTTVVALTGGIFAGKIETDDVTHTLSAASIADADAGNAKVVTYTATLTGAKAGNYTVTVNDVKVNIAKATYNMTGVTFVDASKVYNGAEQTLAIGGTVLPTGVTVAYSAGIKDVGTKTITATFTGDTTNYNAIANKTATLTIITKALTITGVTATDRVYDGTTVVALTVGTLNGKVGADDVTHTLGAGSIENANVGDLKVVTYTATLTGTTKGNYTVTSNDVKVNIAKATYDMSGVKFVDETKVYSGVNQAIAITGTLPQGVTVKYSGAFKNPFTDKPITATFTGDAINYNAIPDMTALLTITPKALTITGVTATDRAYDGTTVVTLVRGTLNGANIYDEVDYKLSEGSIVSADMGNDKVVTYTATLINREKDNYTVTSNVVTVNITAKAIAVVWGTTQLPYTATAIAPTATVATGIVGETIALTVAGQKTAIGTGYTATATMTTANANYTLTNTTVTYAIVESEVSKAEALAAAKATEIGKLDTAKANYTQANYSSANWTTITGYYDTAKSGINAVTVIGSLPGNFVTTFTTNANAVKTTVQETAEALAAAKVTEIGKLDTAKATYKQADYSPANWTTITGYYNTAKSGINGVTVIGSLPGNFVTTFTTNAGAVKTTAQETAEALAAAKATEINDLNTAKAAYKQINYSVANWDIITGYYNTAANEINAVTVITNLPGNFVKTFMINSNAVQTIDQEAATIYEFTPIDKGAAYSLKKKAGATLSANITIPSAYNSIPVTAIDYKAFNGCKELTTVTIPSSVTSIGKQAFFTCSNITQITVPDSVTSIGMWAFDGTKWLKGKNEGMLYINKVAYIYVGIMPVNTSMELTAGTVSISPEALKGCTGLVSITIPGSVKSIGNDAFNGCNALTTITMQNGVASIDARAFNGCTALTNINIPASVTSIVNNPFMNCINLATITVDGANATYKSVGNCVIEKASNTLVIGCKASVIPADGSVTSIGTSAFDGCANLTSITIPSTVTSIGDYAFQSCTELREIVIPNGVISIGEYAFTICSQLATVTIPFSVQTIRREAFTNCGMLKTINCEAASKPSGWDATWNTTTATVVYKGATTAVTNVAELTTALANAKDGDTISLAAGNFATDLTITKSIKFVGAGVASTTITGAIIVSGVDKTVSFEGIKIHRETTNTNGVITITSNATVNVKDCVIEHKDKDGGFTTNTTGVRMEGANAKLYLVNTIIDVAYYGVGMRNIGQVVDIQGGKITGWAAIMTSAGGLTPKPAVPANNKITANGTTLVGRPIVNNQDYAIIVLQQELHGNAVTFTNCTFDLIDNYGGGTDMGACYAVFDIRSSNNTIKTIGCTMSKPIKYTLSVGGTATPQTALPSNKFVANSFDINMTLPASYAIKIDIGGANEKQNEELNYSPVVKINNQNYYIVANSAQLATAATAAVANDTIILGVGTFADPVVINAPITLIGQGADKTIVTTCTINSSAVVKDVTITNRTNQ